MERTLEELGVLAEVQRRKASPVPSPAANPPPAAIPGPGAADARKASSRRRLLFWMGLGALGAGAVVVATGVGLGASARSVALAQNALPPGTEYSSAIAAQERGARQRAQIAYGLYAAGGVLAAGGLTLVIWNRPTGESLRFAPAPGGASLQLVH